MPTQTITFEGLAAKGSVNNDVSSYAGFDWANVGVMDKKYPVDNGPSGYEAVAHQRGLAFNKTADNCGMFGDDFTIKSGHFAAAWNIGLQVTFTAFDNGHQVAEMTVTIDQVDTLITFDSSFRSIDIFVIHSEGGTLGTGTGSGTQVAFDNLKVTTHGGTGASEFNRDHAGAAQLAALHDTILGAHLTSYDSGHVLA